MITMMHPKNEYAKGLVFDEISKIKPKDNRHAYINLDSVNSTLYRDEDGLEVTLQDAILDRDDIVAMIEIKKLGENISGGIKYTIQLELSILIFTMAGDYTVGEDFASQILEVLKPYGFYRVEEQQRENLDDNLITQGIHTTLLTLKADQYSGYKWNADILEIASI